MILGLTFWWLGASRVEASRLAHEGLLASGGRATENVQLSLPCPVGCVATQNPEIQEDLGKTCPTSRGL